MSDGYNIIPPQYEVALAPRGPFPDGAPKSASLDPHGVLMGSMYEAPFRMRQKYKETFFAASQASTTWTTGVAAGAHTGFAVSLSPTAKKNVLILRMGFVYLVAPVSTGTVGIAVGWFNTGIVTHGTPLTVYDGQKALPTTQNSALADGGYTIPATAAAVFRQWILGAMTAGALPSPNQPIVDGSGLIEIQPGGWVELACITAVVGLAFAEWAEVDP
jgi:hypothetical protein